MARAVEMPHKQVSNDEKIERHPLQLMLARLADGQPCNGAELARAMGVTRAAVWKQIERLRQRGVPVDGQAGRGYCLAWPLELLDGARIRAAVPSATRGQMGELHVLWETVSTSTEARRMRLPDCSFVLAEGQSGGRGRRGRPWLSPPGLNIYLTCVKRFDGGVAVLSGLSLAVGVMLLRALADVGVDDVGLKWPNDVLGHAASAAPGAKLAGVLVELDGEYGGPCTALIGVGINLRLPPATRAEVGQSVTDLAELCGGTPPSRNALAGALIAQLLRGLADFERDGFAAFSEAYARHDLLRDQRIQVSTPQRRFTGIAAGVDRRGALCVRCGNELLHVDSAEVSVRAT